MVMYNCDKCGKKFKKKYNFTVHMNRKYDCTQNTVKTTSIIDVQKQADIYDQSMVVKGVVNNKSQKKYYVCTYCNKSYTRSDNLKKHIDTQCASKKSCLLIPKNKWVIEYNINEYVINNQLNDKETEIFENCKTIINQLKIIHAYIYDTQNNNNFDWLIIGIFFKIGLVIIHISNHSQHMKNFVKTYINAIYYDWDFFKNVLYGNTNHHLILSKKRDDIDTIDKAINQINSVIFDDNIKINNCINCYLQIINYVIAVIRGNYQVIQQIIKIMEKDIDINNNNTDIMKFKIDMIEKCCEMIELNVNHKSYGLILQNITMINNCFNYIKSYIGLFSRYVQISQISTIIENIDDTILRVVVQELINLDNVIEI